MRFRNSLCFALALALPLAAAGCLFAPGDDDNGPPPPPPPPAVKLATAPDTLMMMFRVAYTGMDSTKYEAVLDPSFRFLFNPIDVTRFNLPSAFLTRADDLRSSGHMFSGRSLVKPDGTVPGVSDIHIAQFARTTQWTPLGPDNPDFPNSQYAIFNIAMSIARVSNSTTLLINGQQQFYVSERDTTVGGQTMHYYELIGQRDLTSITGKATEGTTWGTVKTLY